MKSYAPFFLFMLSISATVGAQTFSLSAVSDLTNVFDDGFRLPAQEDTIRVFGMRGEVISAQCVIAAKNDLKNVTVAISQLRHKVTGAIIGANFISWNFVGSILLTQNAPNQ